MILKEYINLMRIRQWYKNLVIFLPIIFVGNLFHLESLLNTTLGFISLALVSSAGYFFNDILDKNYDKHHPEKKNRPIASGKISIPSALFFMVLLLIISFSLAYNLSIPFLITTISLFIITIIYTLLLKKIIFADILTIGILFVIRAASGTFIINVSISPWLVLCTFFLSLFLSTGKRCAENTLTKENEHKTRAIIKEYKQEITTPLMIIATTLLIMSYALYSFLSTHKNIIFSIPLSLFVIFRYYYLLTNKPSIARNPEKVIKDTPMLIGILLWVIVVFLLIYV